MEDFLLCNGDETQEIVKPTGEHDFCIQRFIGMSCTRKPEIFIWAIPHNDSAILPTPYPIQKGLREFSQSPFPYRHTTTIISLLCTGSTSYQRGLHSRRIRWIFPCTYHCTHKSVQLPMYPLTYPLPDASDRYVFHYLSLHGFL